MNREILTQKYINITKEVPKHRFLDLAVANHEVRKETNLFQLVFLARSVETDADSTSPGASRSSRSMDV